MTSKMIPKVSVIMPCYNHASYLAESIESILGQSFGDLELIVVDDCSSDGSRDIINNFTKTDSRVVPVFHKINGGEAKSRNDALRLANGAFIGFCDSDDIWEKDKLDQQINYFELNPSIGALHSDSIIIDEKSEQTGVRFSTHFQQEKIMEGDLFLRLCLTNFINVPTVLLRKNCLSDAGFFEEGFTYLTDWIYWAKVASKNQFGYITSPLARYRIHTGSTMHDSKGYLKSRIMGHKFLLERFEDIPPKIRSKMLYSIGVSYLDLNDIPEAQNYLWKSVYFDRWNLKGIYRLITSLSIKPGYGLFR